MHTMLSDLIIEKVFESFMLEGTGQLLPGDLPSRREFLIQVGKLRRTALKARHSKHDWKKTLAGEVSLKKMKKRMGKEAQQIQQQAKKVHQLSEKLFKEFLRSQRGTLTNAEYRDWRRQYDAALEVSKQRMKRQMVGKRLAEQMRQPTLLPPYKPKRS